MESSKRFSKKTLLTGMKDTNKTFKKILAKPKSDNSPIINLKGQRWKVGSSCEKDPNIVYCGRQMFRGGWKLKKSKWADIFKVSDYGTIEKSCEAYEKYVRSTPALMKSLNQLVGKKLACWCYPKPCHTDVLVKLMKEKKLIKKNKHFINKM